MIDLSDLDSWKPQKAGAVDLSDLDSWKPPESERDRIQKAKAEAIWGGSFDEWKARKEQADAEQARMVAESEAGNVGSRRAQEFQRKTEALNREGMITGDFSPDSLRAERALESGRLSAQAALGGALRLAGETADQAAEFSGLGYGSEMAGKALGILNAGADPASTRFALASMKSDPRKPNALAHAGSEIYDAAITEQADLSPLMIERPESLMSGQGLKYIAQGALQSAPVTATGLAAAMLNPEIGLLMIGGSAAGAKFGESRAEDRDYWLSAEAAAVAAATETVPEVLPILALSGKLLKYIPKGLGAKLAKIPGGRAVATSLAEGGSEVVTELGNIAYEIAREGKEYSADEVANRLVDSFAIGTAIGGAMGGAASAAGVGGDAYNQNVIDVLERDNMRRAAMDRRTPATNGQPLTAPINFTTEAAKLTNKLLGDAPPTVSAGADLAEQAIADAGLNRPSQSPQLTTAAEVDSLLAGVESQAPSFVGGENGLAATGGIEGSLGGIEIGGRGNGAVEGIASTGAQVSDVNGERGSAGDIATPPGVTTLPDGTTFVPGNPAELRQRLADAGIPTRGVIRTIDGVEGVRFGRDTAQTVLGVLGGSQQGATTGAQALGVPDSNAASGVTGAQSRNEQLGLQAGSGVSAQRAADQGQSNPVADGMAGIAQDQSGVSAAQSTEPTQAQGAAEPSARFPNGVPESLRGLTDPELDQFAGLEAEIHAATSAQGGKAIMNDKGEAIGRQRWAIMEPDSGFWRQRTQKITAKEGIAALRKAQSGEKLTRKEANFVNYAKEWAKTYADNLIANEVASQTEYKASQRESATAEIESTMASVADTSPQQRASVQSLGSDYTEQLIALKRARKAGQLNPDQQEQYIDLLEQDRETGKVAGRPMVGIGNKTAYVDALMEGRLLPVQVFVDADNFKSLNDKFGHDVGDDVIRLLADEMVAEFGEGNVFHRGGDEFLTQGNTQEEADAKMARVQERMMGLRLELPLSDGRTAILPGVGVSYGTGSNEKVADDSLKQDKERRKAAGLRTDRRSGDDAGSVGAQPASSGAQASRTNQGDSAAAGAGQVNGVQPNARTQAPVRGADSVAPARAKSVDAVQGFDVEGARAELTETLGPKFLRRLESQPWFHLVDSLDQIPEKVRKSLTDAESAAGFVHSDGDVYIIAGNIDSNVTGVVLHEVGVHFGMPKILGGDFASTLANFRRLKAKNGLVADAYARVPKDTPANLIDEEALAYYVEANWNQDVPLMAKIVNAVKAFLNRMGVPLSRLNASPELLVSVARGAADRASRGLVTVKGGKVKYHKAWHGSPHDFDQFRYDDTTSMTGEGAQAFGAGLYFAGREELGEHYRSALSGRSVKAAGKTMSHADFIEAVVEMAPAPKSLESAVRSQANEAGIAIIERGVPYQDYVAKLRSGPYARMYAGLADAIESMAPVKNSGRLYEVELAPKESDYLDWDKPLSEQSEGVRQSVYNLLTDLGMASTVANYYASGKSGAEVYREISKLTGGDKAASARLKSERVPGIRYLDGSSRGKGEGSHNYVIFDDKSVSVVNKYSFAGRNAKTANIGTLEQAEKMIADGASAEDARKATGWHKGVDGKWRFEIDDSGAKFTDAAWERIVDEDGNNVIRLGDALNHPQLFAAYPEIENYGVMFTDGGLGRAKGNFANGVITIERGQSNPLSTLLHEIQHGIQDVEGFSSGGNMGEFLREQQRELRSLYAKVDEINEQMGEASGTPRYLELMDERSDVVARIREVEGQDGFAHIERASNQYKSLSGETEARNVQTRQKFSADERREKSPQSTQDVADEKQIVRYSRRADGGSDTIKVDGKDRPTTDSTGKRIHPTDEGVRNFWRWFGDSKVVDGQGRPLVVYHGTNQQLEEFSKSRLGGSTKAVSAREGFFFTSNKEEAGDYADFAADAVVADIDAHERKTAELQRAMDRAERRGNWDEVDRLTIELESHELGAIRDSKGANVVPVYLSIQSPLVVNVGGMVSTGEVADAIRRARSAGDDGVILRDIADGPKRITRADHYAVIESEQIKSAIGNSGAFSPTDSRIAYSRKVPRTAAQETALAKAGMPEDNRTLAQRGKDYIASQWGKVRDLASLATVDSVFDRFHRMSSIEQELGVPPERSAYISARLAAGLPSIMEGVMMYGAPKWDGGVLTVDESTVGLLDALEPVKDDINGWLGWMVGRRAKVLKAQGRENLMDDADIAALLSLSKGREQEFQEAALKYLRIKKAILDVAEQAGLIDPTARATWDSVEYIPFYRQDETEGDTIGPGTRKGLEGQSSGIRQLKGGQQNLADPLGNIVRNFTKLIDSSLKNNAVLEAVDGYGPAFFERVPMSGTMERIPLSQIKKVLLERGVPQTIIDAMPQGTLSGLTKMWSVKPPSDEDVVRVMRGGKAEYYRVPDKDLLLALTSFKVKSTGLVVSPFKFFKKLLTAGVTSSPEFMARNFVRDSLSSWVISDDKFAVGWDSAKGVISPLLDKTTQKEMMFAGGSFIGGHFYDVGSDAETAKSLRRALRGGTVKQSASAILGFLKGKGLSAADAKAMADTIVTSPVALWDKWQKVGSYLENANRNAIFENAIKAGRSRKEAAYLARDLMDFSMHGNSAFIQIASDVLPFFNARLQGLYKLYRQGGKKALRKALLMRAGITVGMTLGLLAWNLMMYADGYDELEDWDKDTYWHIMPGTKWHIRIPKPFELGVLFATVPERVARAVTYQIPGGDAGDTPKQTMNSFLAQVGGTLAMNPIPQGVMPIVEQWANKTFFTGRPIENMGDEKLLPEARAEWYTSDTAKAISGMIGNKTGLSPKRIEHLWNGYTGTMGAYALDTVDWLVRSVEGTPDRPELAWSEMPLAKAFYRGDSPPKNTRYTTEFYDLAEKADQVSGTIKDYLVSGETEKALKLEAENAALLGKRVKSKTAKAGIMFENVKTYAKIKRELSDIRKQIEGVIVMPGISPEAKRARIEQLTMRRNKLTRDAIAASRRTGR